MRRILFRGKRSDNGEWVEGGYYIEPYTDEVFIVRWNSFGLGYRDFLSVDPETVGQFTGLTDKNGTKIFEGDIIKTDNGIRSAVSIVKYGHHAPGMFYELFERHVGYSPKECLFGLFGESNKGEQFFMADNPKCIEVIGNIHDNPELMEG